MILDVTYQFVTSILSLVTLFSPRSTKNAQLIPVTARDLFLLTETAVRCRVLEARTSVWPFRVALR